MPSLCVARPASSADPCRPPVSSDETSLKPQKHYLVPACDPTDHARVLPVLRERLGDAPMLVLDAPVCRPGWLIEIEGIATIPVEIPELPPF